MNEWPKDPEIVKLRHRITTLEKRWKALRKWIHSNPNWSVMATTRDVEIHKAMTEITRKIK